MRIEDFLLCSGKYRKIHLTDYVLDVAIGAYDSERKGNNLSDLMLKHGLKIFRSRMIYPMYTTTKKSSVL